MTTYVDSSALLKRYVDEPDSLSAEALLTSDSVLVSSWLTVVEVRRNLARLLEGAPFVNASRQFSSDLDAFALVACDAAVCEAAAAITETMGVRTLDAVHLASAKRLAIAAMPFVTFDLRQGQAARALGFVVLGC